MTSVLVMLCWCLAAVLIAWGWARFLGSDDA